jgi:uncharacterized protein YeaO (DUF488 family)
MPGICFLPGGACLLPDAGSSMRPMGTADASFAIKRIYEEPADDDGCRVLVDRLWPRGVSKERAQLELWLKEIAPSPPLRKEFAHMQERFEDFRAQYEDELADNPAVDQLLELAARHRKVTLLYAARDPEVNHAKVLLEFLAARGSRE